MERVSCLKRKTSLAKKSFLRDDINLFLMAIPAITVVLVFSYLPMYGIVLAFKNYNVQKGIWGSDWVGLKNFAFFFKSNDLYRVLRNTLGLNLLFIFFSISCAVCFALMMFEVKKAREVKFYQTISILPTFISWVATSYMVYGLLDNKKGMVNQLIVSLGGEAIKFYSEPNWWPLILLLVTLWHGVGYGSIIYYAALMGTDTNLFEAAELDGASKLQQIRYVSIPQLVPIVTLRLIMAVGGIFRSDFGLFYNVTRNVGTLYKTTDVIDTYVYRALMEQGSIGLSSAVGLFQSVVCLVCILITNKIVKIITPENALF